MIGRELLRIKVLPEITLTVITIVSNTANSYTDMKLNKCKLCENDNYVGKVGGCYYIEHVINPEKG